MLIKIFIIYIPLFFAGILVSHLYFSHMIKSLQVENITKAKLVKSLLFRLPIPIIAFLIAGLLGKIIGILSLFAGFTVYQIHFLVKTGKKLKEEVEKEAENLKELNENNN